MKINVFYLSALVTKPFGTLVLFMFLFDVHLLISRIKLEEARYW